MKKILLAVWHMIDRAPYWYHSLDDVDRTSLNTMGFVIGLAAVLGLLMPSWSHASGCEVEEFSNLSEVQVHTIEVCADIAFKDSAEPFSEGGPLVAYSFLSYRIGWCVYHEVYPNAYVEDYHDWLECRNRARGLEYFF